MKRIVLTIATMAALTTGAVALSGSSHAAATAAPPVNEVIVPAPPVRVHVVPAPVVVAAPAPPPVTTTPVTATVTTPAAPAPVVATAPVVTPAPTSAPAPAPVSLPNQPVPPLGVPAEVQSCSVTWTGPQTDPESGQTVIVDGGYGGSCDQANAMAQLHPGAIVTVVTNGMDTAT